MTVAKIFITPGEPAGIGPDITLQAAQNEWPVELIAIADPDVLTARAQLLKLPLTLIPFDAQQNSSHQPGTLKIIPVSCSSKVIPGQLDPCNAKSLIQSLEIAIEHCLQNKEHHALVTGPIHKSLMNQAGITFSGHTEFLQYCCQVKKTVMLFVYENLKIALATTHIPLREVPNVITEKLLIEVTEILHQSLREKFRIDKPTILVSGLNPHAGENGYLGREEIEIIEPALLELQERHISVIGPLSADTLFTPKYLKTADAILMMYHDQALPAVKQMSFGHAVNMTLGLPIIRTSVDHGTALELAGSGQADAGSMLAAIRLAANLIASPSPMNMV